MSLIVRMNPSYEGMTYRAKRDPRRSKLFLGNSMRWQRQGWGQCWARIHSLNARRSMVRNTSVDQVEQVSGPEWLGDDLVGAKFVSGIEHIEIAHATAAGHGDDLRFGAFAPHHHDRAQPFLLGHDDVGDDDLGPFLAENGHAERAVCGGEYLMSAEAKDLLDHLT